MLKRPLNPRFRKAVLRDEKTTTIRDKAWPVRVPRNRSAIPPFAALTG